MQFMSLVISVLYSEALWARSLKATADKLAQETNRIGLGIAAFGITLAAIYLILGRQDAATKITQSLLGLLVLLSTAAIIDFTRGLV